MMILQIISFVLLILSLAGMTYGIVLWRNGSQNNDVLMLERGRRLSLVFGILFIIFVVMLLVSFLVLRRQNRAAPSQVTTLIPTGSGGLQTKDALLLIDAVPVGIAPIRNIVVHLVFNQDVTQAAVEQHISLRRRGDVSAIAGTWTVAGGHASFAPNQTCPAPHNNVRCFDADTVHEILIANTLTSADGDAFRCSIPAALCRFEFTSGSVVDVVAPTVQMTAPIDGSAVPQNSVVPLESLAKDDLAVAVVDYAVDGTVVSTTIVPGGALEKEFRASSSWATEGLALLSRHQITATVYDLAGLSGTSLPISAQVLQTYCFNNEQDEDEEGLDCGGPSCRACEGAVCTVNSDCASGLCVGGFCRAYPIIEEVIEANGAVGNLVTLRGRHFGKEPGRVVFLGLSGDGDDVAGVLPSCENVWTDTQVIVRVGPNAKTGALRLVTADDFYDTTDDDKGGRVIFEVNDERRPGLCAVTPGKQTVGETVTLHGEQLGTKTGDVSFGQTKAGRLGAWADTSIQGVVVPSLTAALTPVRVHVSGQRSNPVFLDITASATLPRLEALSPDRGPVGQIFSIQGVNLPPAPLVKFLNPRTGESVLADTRLPESCLRLNKRSNARAFRVPKLDAGAYEVFAESPAGRSNSVNFTVTAAGRLPGLCAMEPDNGPLGIETVLYGEGFGVNDGQVRFQTRIDNAEVLSWNDGQIRVVVPPNAQTGPVQAISGKGDLSNALPFTVGQCSPDTCGQGKECCADGACHVAGSCAISVPACTYSWTFATGDSLGGIPRVIDSATCKGNTQSPSPYNATIDACSNTVISARFTLDMEDATLAANNIELRRCNTGSVFNSGSCQTTVTLSKFDVINTGQPGEGFTATPQTPFDEDTWYQVTLSTGVKAQNGNALVSPYRWAFKTQAGEGECAIDHVEVTPAAATLRQIGKQQLYTGAAVSLNCNLLNAAAYTWSWLSGDAAKATVENSETASARATAKGPTEPGPAVDIYGAIPAVNKNDKSLLTIALQPPLVTDKWPNCSGACVNAALGARFNQAMQPSSVTSSGNIDLQQCGDVACTRSKATSIGVAGLQYNDTSFTLHFLPNMATFKAATKYRVVLKSLRAASGLELAGLNYDANGDGKSDSYSWLFGTGTDANVCKVERVQVDPLIAESHLILEELDYQALPVGKADACNTSGQVLRGDTSDWSWASGSATVATVTQKDVLPLPNFKDWAQMATSVGVGETKIRASTQGVSGEGDLSVSCGFQNDSQCPSPATLNSHGVGNDSCCWPRPRVVGSNPRDGATQVCTTLAVEVQFDQRMEQSSILSNVFLEIDNGATPCGPQPVGFMQYLRHTASAVWGWIVPSADAQAQNWCAVESSVTVSSNNEGSVARVYPKTKLFEDRSYRVRIAGDLNLSDNVPQGVRNTSNVPMPGEVVNEFGTGKAECKIDVLEVEVTPPGQPTSYDVVFCAVRNDCRGDVNAAQEGNQHGYKALARDVSGFVVPATFTWAAGPGDLFTLSAAEGESVEMTPKAGNGETSVTVTAAALAPSKGTVSRTLDVFIFLCENPWPSILNFPYVDNSFNFDIFYCRDFGEPGTQDDLPPLSNPVKGSNIGGVLQESIFIVE